MPKRKTISDIAKACDVSPSTVSLVLNNSPKISAATRDKVLAVIAQHGYRPNVQARNLAFQSSRTVSVVLPDIDHVFADHYFGEILSGVYAGATNLGYKVLIDLANKKFIQTQEYLQILDEQRADGMLVAGATNYDQYLSVFSNSDRPFMLVNHYFPDLGINFVSADARASARAAAEHLLSLGHRHIGVISGTNIQTATDFLETFGKCLADAGIKEENRPWADGRFSDEMGYEAARVILALNSKLTAIMAGNGKMAIGAMRFAQEQGLKVPEDISVMAADDSNLLTLVAPKISAIDNHLYDLGTKATQKLIALSRGEIRSCREFLPVELKIRESTGPARKKK